jgi:hypothetical protein
MKAKYKYKNTGQPCSRLKIQFTIDSTNIENAIVYMLFMNIKINKTTVTKELRSLIFSDGYSWDEYMDERVGEDVYEDNLPKAKELSEKLFSEFYCQ